MKLRQTCIDEPDVDLAWDTWCNAAELGLLEAYKVAGGPCPQGDPPFLGRRKAVFRTRLVGGRMPGRVRKPAMVDLVDSCCCFEFVNSSLSPVLLFRRKLCVVVDVLKGMRKHRFSTSKWQALKLRWSAVCGQGLTCPVLTQEPCKDWLPQICMVFKPGFFII